jgi:hypothetical protein
MNFKKNLQLTIAFLFFTLACFGCGHKNETQQENNILKAYRLIDEQRTDEAIELLENSLAEDPQNTDYKSVLASAYAHKAGIKIQKLVPAINQAEKLKKIDDKSASTAEPHSAIEKVNADALNIAALLGKFAGFFEVYASIPLVSKEQGPYLSHAIYLLNDIGNTIKPEDVLYRAVLEIVLLKHILAENLVGEFVASPTKDKQTCLIDIGSVNDTVVTIGKLMIDIYNDIGFANPQQAEAMKKLANETSDSVSNITIATTTVTVLDEAATIFLKQAAIQNGFGKIIKCGGN